MLNSINTEIKVPNSIETLSFLWCASFQNNDIIFQYEKGKENQFKLVKDRFSELKYFCLYHKEGKCYFIVDLEKGSISFNNHEDVESEEKKYNIRLIIFRRHRIEMGATQNHSIVYYLGYQYNLENGENRKVIFEINEDGSFIVRS